MSLAFRRMPLGVRLTAAQLAWIVTALLLLLGTATAAYGFWSSITISNNAAAAADALSPGSKPAVAANGTALSVTWAGGTTVNGQPATGYTVTRYSAASGGTGTAATSGCAGTVTTLTCTEQNVPGGIWYYTVTPAIALWTGAESPRSNGTSNDATAPVATVSSVSPTPNAAGWNNASPATVTITADDGAAGSGVASITYTLDGGAQQTVSGATATVPVSGDGTHTVSYFATDKVGNASTAQTQTVRIDRAAPVAPGLAVPPYVNSSNVAAVSVTGTSEAGAKITLTAGDTGTGAPHSVTVTATASGTGTWSASLNLSTFKQGTVNYSATATDAAGNTGTAATATNTKDTVAPAAVQGLIVPAYVNISNVSAVPVSGTAEAGGTVSVTASDAGSAHAVTGTATASGTGSWSLNLSLGILDQGTVTYAVTVRDAAGNTGAASSTTDIKDTVAPVVTITAPMYVNSNTASAVTVNGTSDAGTAVNVTVRDSALKAVTTQVTPSGTSWTATLNLTTLGEGSLTYTAATADAAGNSTTATAAGTTSKDTVAPSVSKITLANGSKVKTADKGDTVTLEFSEAMDPSRFCSGWTGSVLSGTATLADNGNSDTISFATSGCSGLSPGTIFLGANYIGTPSAIFGASGTASTLVLDSTGKILTIQLGNAPSGQGAGTPLTSVTPGKPAYTPASNLADLAGNLLGTGTVTSAVDSGF